MSGILRFAVLLWLGLFGLTWLVWRVLAPHFDGSGREIAFLQLGAPDVTIRLYDRHTGLLYDLPDLNLAPSALSWSPDGSTLALTNGYSGREIMTLDRHNLTTQRLAAYGERDQSPVWSPTGEHIAFLSSADDDPMFRPTLYVMDADGRNARRVNLDGELTFSPTWSPDGEQIAFISIRDGVRGVFTIDLATGDLRMVLGNSIAASYSVVQWSPDGRYLAFIARFGAAHANLFVLDMTTDRILQLTSGPFSDDYPTWSPGGDSILFVSNRNTGTTQNTLFSIRPDGSGLRQISNEIVNIASPVWRP